MPYPAFSVRNLFVAFLICPFVLTAGCATDNDFLSQLPGFEARSDNIPGLATPLQRKNQIREKAKKGKSVPDHEREIMLGQLLAEYRDSPDQNIRRETVEAMSKIPHPNREACIKEALADQDPFVRISACKALANHEKDISLDDAVGLCATLRRVMNTDADKDVRITAMKLLGTEAKRINLDNRFKVPPQTKAACDNEYKAVVADLGKLLEDKAPSVRYRAMISLHDCTGREYGVDIDKWIAYIEYREGTRSEAPQELSWTERIPPLKLPMLM